MYNKKWLFKENSQEMVESLMERYKIPRLAASVLQNRLELIGKNNGGAKKTLSERLHDPFLLNDMDKATERIKKAITSGEHITIYGDYDADGVTSTVVLYLYLKDSGANVDYYIPNRVEEGYGINMSAVDKIKENGASLIITVDTGVTAFDEVDYACSLGMDIIVTDHHECKDEIPKCCAVIDAKRPDSTYPFSELAGVGVVFKLISALNGGIEGLVDKYMALVCLGTIADVAPLIDENRVFAALGIKYFPQSGNKGIDALLQVTDMYDKKLTAGKIGFVIAPRINAAGRLGSADKSVELFLCNDSKRALEIASELSDENKARQNMEQQIFNEAMEIIERDKLYNDKVIVVAKEGWHHGVIGIVSSKITEEYYKPSILISIDGEDGKGSGRSIATFNLFEALSSCAPIMEQFGGHSLAAGLSVKKDNIDKLRKGINEYANNITKPEDFIPIIYIDSKLTSEDITIENTEKLGILEPYGMGNPSPVFALDNAKIILMTTMSEGKHLKMLVEKDGVTIEVLGFNYGCMVEKLKKGDYIDVAGGLNINIYKGVKKLQLLIKDIKLHKE